MRKTTILFTLTLLFALLGTAGFLLTPSAQATDALEFEGRIESFPAGLVGTWVVDGQTFIANESTSFDTEEGSFGVGVCVDVYYLINNGTNIALEIETDIDEDNDCGDDNNGGSSNQMQVYGRLDSFPAGLLGEWVVAGVSYTADAQTDFDTEDGNFAPGVCVEVKYDPNNNRAYEIETEDDYNCNGQSNPAWRNVKGIVESFPAGLVGEWVVNGVTYTAVGQTEFETDDGPFFVGRCVEIKFDPTNNQAYEIETEDDDCHGNTSQAKRKVYGLLTSRPAGSLLGDWVVNGATYTADAQTEFDNDEGDFVIGACLSIEYFPSTSGPQIAHEIETEEGYHCQGGTAANWYQGQLESFPPSLYGVWVIDGLSFMTDPATDFDDDDSYQLNDCIEVKYYTVNGVNRVIELDEEDDCGFGNGYDDDQYGNKLYATLDSFPAGLVGEWVIGGQTFTATVNTEFNDDEDDDGPFVIGQCVSAEYNNQQILHEVETEDAYKCEGNGTAVFKLYGTVNQLPPAPFVGQWQIAGKPFSVTVSTQLEQNYGLFGVGSFVEVKYVLDGNTAVATEIETRVAPGAGLNQGVGIVNNFDRNDNWQDWTINNQTFKASPVIRVNRQPETNSRVLYNSYTGLDGQTYLTSVTATTDVYLPIVSIRP